MTTDSSERKDGEPITIEVPANKVRVDFSTFVNRASVRGDRIVLLRHGKRTAALVSLEDLKKIQGTEAA